MQYYFYYTNVQYFTAFCFVCVCVCVYMCVQMKEFFTRNKNFVNNVYCPFLPSFEHVLIFLDKTRFDVLYEQ